MYYDLCNGSVTANVVEHQRCHETDMMQLVGGGNGTLLYGNGTGYTAHNGTVEEWGMERTVRIVVPLFFGVIGLAGLLGNALVIVGKCSVVLVVVCASVSETCCLCAVPSLDPRSDRYSDSTSAWYRCTVVAANQQMRSTTNLLIINLAVSDIMFVIFCVPFTATDYVLPTWPFGDLWCKVVSVKW